jgi:hypothetical protein
MRRLAIVRIASSRESIIWRHLPGGDANPFLKRTRYRDPAIAVWMGVSNMTEITKQAKKSSFAGNGNGETYAGFMAAGQEGFSRWFDTMTTISEEMAHFAQNRWNEDMAAWSALAGCRTPEDAMECHRRFTEKAMTQYSDEFAKLSRLMMGLTGTEKLLKETKLDVAS